jgi:cytochrome c oxidase assembly protein subunit 15
MTLTDTDAPDVATPVRRWLIALAIVILCIVVVGGATRLTDSGLSITEWQPLIGIVPPLSDTDWIAAFEMYKQIPEFKLQNSAMTLNEFKVIYWWEWAHRFLARLAGLIFIVPFVVFLALGKLERRHLPRLLLLLLLGAAQGALGWYMVRSGLVDRVDVSQYRLAAHLTLAAAVFALTIWSATCLNAFHRRPSSWDDWFALLLLLLVFLQIGLGGLVAGLDAGMGYNTWPKMDGAWVPGGLTVIDPLWRNLFENALTVQFVHRLIAYALAIAVLIHAWQTFSLSAAMLAYAAWVQAGIGIVTVLMRVPLPLGLLHQAMAMLVLLAAVWHLHRMLAMPVPVPDRQ